MSGRYCTGESEVGKHTLSFAARREIMLAPVSVTYSPKRSPKENLSPGFSHLLSRNENTVTRYEPGECSCVLTIFRAAGCLSRPNAAVSCSLNVLENDS